MEEEVKTNLFSATKICNNPRPNDFLKLPTKSNTQRKTENFMKTLDLSHIGNKNEPDQGNRAIYTQATNGDKSGKEDNRNDENFEQTNSPNMGVDMRKNIQMCEPHINPVNKMNVGATRILPHLYLGSQKDVMNQKMMENYGITYVLNVSKTCTQPSFIDNDHFHRISVRDNHQEKMMPYMKEAITFIEKVRKLKQRVLVHCLAGVSRSATVAIAYVIYYNKMNFEESYRFVQEKRKSISPNFNFLGQLMEFEKSLKKEGHMTTCRGQTVLENENCNCARNLPVSESEYKKELENNTTNRTLNFYKESETELPQFILPVTCSVAQVKPSAMAPTSKPSQNKAALPHTPVSSFCKRKRAPVLSKIVFTQNSRPDCSTRLATPAVTQTNYEQEPLGRLRIDLKVAVPPRVTEHKSRLGSDGTEMDDSHADRVPKIIENIDEEMTKIEEAKSAPNTPPNQHKKPTSLPLKRQSILKNGHRRSASSGLADIELNCGLDLKRRLWDSTCKSTSCLSPPVTEPTTNKAKRSSSLKESLNYFNLSAPSLRSPRKFVSCSSRSPKIMRKTLNLPLRPSYPYSPNGVARQKSQDSTIKFDCTGTMNTPIDQPLDCKMTEDDDLTLNSISPLTISSPTTDKDIDIFAPDQRISSPATCPVRSTNPFSVKSSRLARHNTTATTRVAFNASISYNQSGEEGRTFTLTAGCDLKPKWRNRNKRRQSCDSGYASSQTSSSFTSPTSHVTFSPCEAPIEDDPAPTEPMSTECAIEPSSPLPSVGCRKGVEIMSCS